MLSVFIFLLVDVFIGMTFVPYVICMVFSVVFPVGTIVLLAFGVPKSNAKYTKQTVLELIMVLLFGVLLVCSDVLLSEEARMTLRECMRTVNFSTRAFFEKW